MPVRIKGLVRAFNDVRGQLHAGISFGQEEHFKNYVRALVAEVEKICEEHGTAPDSLPPQSRMAYAFLKNLDSRDLPKSDPLCTAASLPQLRVANVVKGADMFSKRMWDDLPKLLESQSNRKHLALEMQELVSRIESICSQHDTTPSSLETPSRRAYGWLKLLLEEANLWLHLAALDRGRSALVKTNPRANRIELHMANINSIWRRRTRGKCALLKVNQGFIHASDEVWRAVINVAFKKRGDKDKGIIDKYIDTEAFSGVLFEIEAFTETTSTSPGNFHNLDESFERVNSAYFSGSLLKPRLRWNRVLTARKFGHYESARDTVMLSLSLDDPAVPQLLVDYIMYHELLHKYHSVKLANGRRLAHTPAFRKDDQSFKGYKEVIARLDALASKHGSS